MKAVLVVWRDIVDDSGWKTQNQVDRFLNKLGHDIVNQLGFLLEEDEDRVVIVDSYFPDHSYYGLVTKIPRGCILEIKELFNIEQVEQHEQTSISTGS